METLLLLSTSTHHAQQAFGMPGVWEWAIILVIVLLIFGPGKLPQIGEALGKGIKSFKKATENNDEIDVTPKQLEENAEPAEGTRPKSPDEKHAKVPKD